MTHKSKKRDSRGRILDALRRELLGPSQPDETILEFPTTRYNVGRLAPAMDQDDEALMLNHRSKWCYRGCGQLLGVIEGNRLEIHTKRGRWLGL